MGNTLATVWAPKLTEVELNLSESEISEIENLSKSTLVKMFKIYQRSIGEESSVRIGAIRGLTDNLRKISASGCHRFGASQTRQSTHGIATVRTSS